MSRERPFLYVDDDGHVAGAGPVGHADSSGVTWANGPTRGGRSRSPTSSSPRPSDSVTTINSQLARGKHLLLTPGVYDVDRSITVRRADTVVLAMGLASLTARGERCRSSSGTCPASSSPASWSTPAR